MSRTKFKLMPTNSIYDSTACFSQLCPETKENVSLREVSDYQETCKGSPKGNELRAVRFTSLCKHFIAMKYQITWESLTVENMPLSYTASHRFKAKSCMKWNCNSISKYVTHLYTVNWPQEKKRLINPSIKRVHG